MLKKNDLLRGFVCVCCSPKNMSRYPPAPDPGTPLGLLDCFETDDIVYWGGFRNRLGDNGLPTNHRNSGKGYNVLQRCPGTFGYGVDTERQRINWEWMLGKNLSVEELRVLPAGAITPGTSPDSRERQKKVRPEASPESLMKKLSLSETDTPRTKWDQPRFF